MNDIDAFIDIMKYDFVYENDEYILNIALRNAISYGKIDIIYLIFSKEY